MFDYTLLYYFLILIFLCVGTTAQALILIVSGDSARQWQAYRLGLLLQLFLSPLLPLLLALQIISRL